jgi:glycosyltransferase involved in cell wall biosynthesis
LSRPILYVTARSWPSKGGIQGFLQRVARDVSLRRPARVVALLADDRPMTRSLQHAELPQWGALADGRVQISCVPATYAERAWLLPLNLWRARVPASLYDRARSLSRPFYVRAVAPALERAGRECALIHVFGGDVLGVAAARAARRLRVPLVLTPFAHRAAWGDDPLNLSLYRSADAVLSLLDAEAAWYREWGVDPARIHTTGIWTELEPPAQLPQEVPQSAPVILFLGVRRPYKGYDLLAAAAPQVWAAHPDAVFVFAGPEGGGESPVPRGGRTVVLGNVSEGVKAALLRRASLLCLPSASEILPTVILESWLSGRPVVARDIPTLRELVGDGGELVPGDPGPLAAAIIRLIGDPALAARRAAAGARQLRRYSRDVVMARLESVYAEVGA